MFGALAHGETLISGLLEGDDVLRTADAMRSLGADVTRLDDGRWRVIGTGGRFQPPSAPLDFGNSGTGCRLALGLLAGTCIAATFTGDESLSSRPMERILAPLRAMGVDAKSRDGRLPVTLPGGGAPRPIRWESPIASAQVKSAVLLAGLGAEGRTEVVEPVLSRDHTERLLAAFGVTVTTRIDPTTHAAQITLDGPAQLTGCAVTVPADPSSSAFLAAAALVAPGSQVTIERVMANPTRDGFFRALASMNARATASPAGDAGGETLNDWTLTSGELRPFSPDPAGASSMIDEYPVLAVLAAYANGESRFEGVGELRVKESDRIAATVAMLRANGVDAEELEEGFVVRGRGPGSVRGGGRVATHHDHRIAMSALVLGLGAQEPVTIDDASMIDTSYPTFFDHMRTLGADMARLPQAQDTEPHEDRPL